MQLKQSFESLNSVKFKTMLKNVTKRFVCKYNFMSLGFCANMLGKALVFIRKEGLNWREDWPPDCSVCQTGYSEL